MIYENLEPSQLLNDIATIDPINRCLAETVLRQKFREQMLWIDENGLYALNSQQRTDYVGNMDTMYSALKTIGHSFRKLTINYKNFREWECGQVYKRISKYVAGSLIEITLKNFDSIHFKNFYWTISKCRMIDPCRLFHQGKCNKIA